MTQMKLSGTLFRETFSVVVVVVVDDDDDVVVVVVVVIIVTIIIIIVVVVVVIIIITISIIVVVVVIINHHHHNHQYLSLFPYLHMMRKSRVHYLQFREVLLPNFSVRKVQILLSLKLVLIWSLLGSTSPGSKTGKRFSFLLCIFFFFFFVFDLLLFQSISSLFPLFCFVLFFHYFFSLKKGRERERERERVEEKRVIQRELEKMRRREGGRSIIINDI